MSDLPYLSIVVPAYQEARRLPPTLRALTEFGKKFTKMWEVWVVVEPSADGTLEIATVHAEQQANFHVLAQPEQRGKGAAVRAGMLHASGAHIFYMDADLSVPLAEIPSFLSYFEQHPEADILLGNRAHAQSRITRRQTLLRRTMGQAFNRVLQSRGLAALHDTQCGFKAFRREAARAIFSRQQIDGFAFDVEVLLLAERLGFTVADLPVEWINSPESKVHIIGDSLAMLRDTFRVRRLIERSFPGA
jgi:glycosyltransferase involved in cell wall biosynthesis